MGQATITTSPLPFAASTNSSIIYRTGRVSYQLTDASHFSITKPYGMQTDDLMVAHVVIQGEETITSVPSGWSLIRGDVSLATTVGCRMYSYYKVVGASEPGSYTWRASGGTDWCIGITAYDGVDTGAPIDASAGTSTASSSDTTCSAPSITPTATNCMLITAHAFNPSVSSNVTCSQTPPSGMTERLDAATNGGSSSSNQCTLEVNTLQLTSGATGIKTSTMNNSQDGHNVGHSIALKPSSSGTGTPTPFTVAFWFKQPANQTAEADSYVQQTNGSGSMFIYQRVGGSARVAFRLSSNSGGTTVGLVESVGTLAINTAYLVVCRYDGATTMKIKTSYQTSQNTVTALGAAWYCQDDDFEFGLASCAMDDVAVWQRYLTDAEVDNLITSLTLGSDTTVTVVGDVLDLVEWPSDKRAVQGTGVVTANVPSYGMTGKRALESLREVSVTERGALYMTNDGKLAFESLVFQQTDSSRTSTVATFGSSGGQIPYRAVDLSYDDDLANEIKINNTTSEGGAVDSYQDEHSAEDATSVAAYGRITRTLATRFDDPTAATRESDITARLTFEINQSSQPLRRIRSITFGPLATKDDWDTVLAINLLERVRVVHTTPSGIEIDQTLTVGGYTVDYDAPSDTWSMTLQLDPNVS